MLALKCLTLSLQALKSFLLVRKNIYSGVVFSLFPLRMTVAAGTLTISVKIAEI